MSIIPKNVASNPIKILLPVYKKKLKYSASLSIAIFSAAKAEKVVNPPQNPTVRNNRHSEEIKLPFSAIPYIMPINKLPKMFTTKVPYGKLDGNTAAK
jgi:hypothetical protein